ncbi:hypothetical protein [Oceanisphaera arctica]|uniref:Uncharacterized protein n=1 Tax=Oceanisphaera arctica TaxID=641510 RepID=A0A2P5TQN4_9GAMM|nr:hypothetical protein [Oceanisphaera arctica]PPL18067.1 hypothetical protein UN63_02590 [Oceanisphaera arctica]GHA09586.1 hypothetical protein GCM10007082_08150 [Oceanisphaera arctica]
MKLLKYLLPEILGVLFGIVVLAFAYLIFSLVIKVYSSSQFLNLSQGVDATSISIGVAILLFLAKEVIEVIRKRNARFRKENALKTLLSEEVELNHWTWLKVRSLIEVVKEEPESTEFSIITSTSGKELFQYVREDNGGGGQAFPPVYETLINKLIVDVAELDKEFYVAAIDYEKALAELSHLRAGAYDFIHETQQGRHYTDGFTEYASDELPDIFDSMEAFYRVCGHTKLEKHRLR